MLNRYLLAPLAALALLAASLTAQAQTGGVGIGITIPDASAALDITSTSKGLLPPRLSQSQRDAIASPATGLTIYNTTTSKLNTWNGTSWDASLSATEQPLQNAVVTFLYTGGAQTYTVPAGVYSLGVDAAGAQGAVNGGLGGRVQTTLSVTPGEVLTIYVGGAGAKAPNPGSGGGGYNGGGNGSVTNGGGGGGTDIRRGSAALTDRVVVAGGGGGTASAVGGAGGGLTGSAGAGLYPGQGGTPSAGGAGGAGFGGGAFFQGGAGRFSGGGGGWYGGGGGGGGNGSSGGGGGGSSYVAATGSSGTVHTPGYRSGNGLLVLTPSLVYAAPVLSGSNFVNVPGDNLGNHTATQNLDLAGNQLVGNGGSQGLAIDNSGNVGIGTTTPGQKLEVAGGIKLTGTGNALTFPDGTTQTTAAAATNLTGDITSIGIATSYNNVVPAAKGGAGTVSGLLKANGSGTVTAAVAGTDYLTPALASAGYVQNGTSPQANTSFNVVGSGTVSGLLMAGSAGVGTSSPDPSAALDVTSTTKGFLPPRLSMSQRDAIASPATGLTIYNTTTSQLNSWNGTNWDLALTANQQPIQNTVVTFGYTGMLQSYTVPTGVTRLTVDASGAQGGASNPGQSVGSRVVTTLTVVPGEVLTVAVGNQGGYYGAPGYNGGGVGGGGTNSGSTNFFTGGGGGATDLRRGGTAVGNRIVVAAGGGGTGVNNGSVLGVGGSGGYPTGSAGSGSNSAQGGTQSAGGVSNSPAATNANGALFQGGNGAIGGGGGGYYGGGGSVNGGGGGGSSFVTPTGSSSTSYTAAASGNGSLTLTPGLVYAAPTLDGTNFVNVPGTWSVSGADVYRASGNVGIGTTTPGQKLDVAGNTTVSGNSYVGGSVGIGTTTPGQKLEVAGQIYASTGGFRFPDNTVQTTAALTPNAVLNQTTLQSGASFNISGNGYVGGNVGIGTTTPSQKLDVAGNANVAGNSVVGGALTAGSAAIAGNATVGGSLGVGTSGPAGMLANTAGNVIATDGNGISQQGLGWVNTSSVGYAGVFYNANNAASGPGLAVKVASTSAAALDVSQGTSAATAGTSLLRVNGNGQVGVGTSSPAGGLHVATGNSGPGTGAGTAGAVLSGAPGQPPYLELRGSGTGTSTTTPYIDFAEASDQDFTTRLISQGGILNVSGAGANGQLLQVNGGLRATSYANISDARFKTNVRPLAGALASVLALRGVRYEWNALGIKHGGTAGAPQVGVLAQEVEKIYPELVSTDKDGYKAVNYAQLTPVLIEALKEQQAQIEALKARAATAEAKATQATTEAGAAKAQAAQATATLDTFEARLRRLEAGGGQAQR